MSDKAPTAACPSCGSLRVWRDGFRKTAFGDVQRFVCRDCGYRFSDKTLNRAFEHRFSRQICVSPERKAKNLVEVEPLKGGLAGATTQLPSKTNESIANLMIRLRNNGYADSTVESYARILRDLLSK